MKKLFDFIIKISPVLVLSFLTIGYATIFRDLGITGTLSLLKAGTVEITGLELDSSKQNPLSQYGSIILDPATGMISLDFDFTLTGANDPVTYDATYLVTIENNSPLSYEFTGFNLNPDVTLSNSNHGGAEVAYIIDTTNTNNTLTVGDNLLPNTIGVVAIKVSITVSSSATISISVDGDGAVDLEADDQGSLLVTLNDNTVDLRGSGTIDCFTIEAINTYSYGRYFSLLSSNRKFNLVKQDGSALDDFYIGAPDENDPTANDRTYTVCIKVKSGELFYTNSSKTTITYTSGSINNESAGNLTILVDKEPTTPQDEYPPEISGVTFARSKYNTNNSSLTLTASWSANDAFGNDITNYVIQLYDASDNSLKQTFNTNSTQTNNVTFTLDSTFLTNNNADIITNEHNYYIKVYGVDSIGNTGRGYCNETNSVYCAKSSNSSLKYRFTVTTSGSNTTFGSNKTAYWGNDYSITVNPSNNYTLDDSATVTRTGTSDPLTSGTHYSYTVNNNTGTVKVFAAQVTNNLQITVNASNGGCLKEGTKILLANGKYKNVEDIEYTDLLAVYSHEQGRIVYEYPIWIEEESYADNYQRTYFSDGTYLDTYNFHGLFSMDSLKYIDVLDPDNFYIGMRVVKFDENGNIKIVTVVKQETFKENIKYYHISSVRYHNIIANDVLTTDGVLEVSNMYTFNPDITWGIDRDIFLKEIENNTEYDLPVFPRHIYKGFRGPETEKLFDKGELNLAEYVRLLNGRMYPTIKDNDGNNMWVIGTSDGDEKLYTEGSTFVVPKPKYRKGIFAGWYNTGDNKIYMPGDTFTVDYSMYLEAIYK